MFKIVKQFLLALVCAAAPVGSLLASEMGPDTPLTLSGAVRLALASDDPYLLAPMARAAALGHTAVSDSQLEDPKIRFGFANWPTNSFSYTQEPMTQVQLGLSQSFPRGNTLPLKREKRKAEEQAERLLQGARRLDVVLETREAWLELRYTSHAASIVGASSLEVAELIGAVQSNFAVGKNKSQDLFRAEMEQGLLADRLIEIQRLADRARARLERRIGVAAKRRVAGNAPMKHPAALSLLIDTLGSHPVMEAEQAKIIAASKDVAIAGERYKPSWAVNVGYGARGGDRADFASVGVSLDVPLFTKNRQDRKVAATKKTKHAIRLKRDAIKLDLRRKLQSSYADWVRLGERIQLYKAVVRTRAQDTNEASLLSYQSGTTNFSELIRSRLTALDTELTLLRLQTDRLKAQAMLLYFDTPLF